MSVSKKLDVPVSERLMSFVQGEAVMRTHFFPSSRPGRFAVTGSTGTTKSGWRFRCRTEIQRRHIPSFGSLTTVSRPRWRRSARSSSSWCASAQVRCRSGNGISGGSTSSLQPGPLLRRAWWGLAAAGDAESLPGLTELASRRCGTVPGLPDRRLCGRCSADYRMNDDHGLLGFSSGGLFVAFSLFARPGAFSRYICEVLRSITATTLCSTWSRSTRGHTKTFPHTFSSERVRLSSLSPGSRHTERSAR